MAQETSKLIFGTATPGGGFPAYGWPYAEVLNAADATLGIEPINTKGSTENIVSLEQDKMDLGLVTGEVTYEAIKGIGGPPAKNIRIINATYSQAGMFIVRADSPYKTIADLKGKPIVWGAATSGFIVLARYVMDGMGLDFRKDFDPILLKSAGEGPPMVLDGRAAAMWGGGRAIASKRHMNEKVMSLTVDLYFLPKLCSFLSFWSRDGDRKARESCRSVFDHSRSTRGWAQHARFGGNAGGFGVRDALWR